MEDPFGAQLSMKSDNTTVDHPPLDLSRAVPVAILLAFIDIITVFGNILVIIAVLTTRSLRNVTCNYYIVSLAVSDLLLGVLVLPFSSVYEILNYWSFPTFFCVVWLSTDVLSCTASILNLLCISLDRYLAISRPLHYHKYSSPKFVYIMIAAAWVLAFLISFAPVFGFDTSGDETDQCRVAASGLFWTLYSSVGSFFLPLLVMLILYYRIYLVAAKHSKFMKEERERYASFAQQQQEFDEHTNRNNNRLSLDQGGDGHNNPVGNHRVSRVTIVSNGTPLGPPGTDYQGFPKDSLVQAAGKKSGIMKRLRRLSKDKKAAKTLFIVMACFILCWLPFFIIYLIDGVCKEVCSIPRWVFKVFFWLGYCNSMLNPVIYTVSSHDFRTAFRKILHCPGSDQFGGPHYNATLDTDYRSTAPRPSGSGTIGNSSNGLVTANTPRQHAGPGVASHLISKTRSAVLEASAVASSTPSSSLHRLPSLVVRKNYALVAEHVRDGEGDVATTAMTTTTTTTTEKTNGLPSKGNNADNTAAGLQSREIANLLPRRQQQQQQCCDLSLGGSSGPDDSSIKDLKTRSRLAFTGTAKQRPETLPFDEEDDEDDDSSPPHTYRHLSPCGSTALPVDGSATTTTAHHPPKNGSPFDVSSGWSKVKVKAQQIVAVLRDGGRGRSATTTTERSPATISKTNTPTTPPQLRRIVSNAGVATDEHELSEKCVQTSISFVDLGAI